MKLAFVFPGQGSQSVGMLNGFAGDCAVDDVMEEANIALGFSLSDLIAQGPADELNLTVNTQPALLATSYAFYMAWLCAGGPKPVLMAGHSLGEYSALTAAEAFTLTEAVKLVRFRAQAMQTAVPVGKGGMAAILGLPDAKVEEICRGLAATGVVEPVNYNCPGQVVIAGERAALEAACEAAKAAGAKRAVMLAVSAPFHSSLLEPAALQLAQYLSKIVVNEPRIPVIANVDAAIHSSPADIREKLALQANHPVQWVRTVQFMKEQGITHVVECGPGRVLAGLIRRIAPEIQCFGLSSAETMKTTLEALKAAQ